MKIFSIIAILIATSTHLFSHCEIPCGIFADSARIDLISEHIVTVDKSMKQILILSKEKSVNYNQLVRWINNKEKHAEEIQELATQYFLFQRVKLPTEKEDKADYLAKLEALHQITVYAMKAKQSTDTTLTASLKNSLNAFSQVYFKSHKH